MFGPKILAIYKGVSCETLIISQDFTKIIVFPLVLSAECPGCHNRHSFRFYSKKTASTEKERDMISILCRAKGIKQFTLPDT